MPQRRTQIVHCCICFSLWRTFKPGQQKFFRSAWANLLLTKHLKQTISYKGGCLSTGTLCSAISKLEKHVITYQEKDQYEAYKLQQIIRTAVKTRLVQDGAVDFQITKILILLVQASNKSKEKKTQWKSDIAQIHQKKLQPDKIPYI